MSSRKENPRLRIRCQHCRNICRTRHLDFDIICPSCGNYAKKAKQKVIPKTEFDPKFGKREVYIVA